MDAYTSQTKETLEAIFKRTSGGVYHAHQPIYGYRTSKGSTSCIARYMVTKSILNVLNRYHFSSFADIGGAEGYTANLVKTLFNPARLAMTDLSENACKMAREIFNLDAQPADIHQLPFEDEAFEVVLCSETIEHVADYKKAIEELLRITKNVLVITVPHETEELVAQNIAQKIPHAHIHYFDVHTLDYLKDRGLQVTYEKTLSPLLVVPRVVAEGFKKPSEKLHFRLYNSFTPLFKKLFGLKTANRITDADARLTKSLPFYGGITFTIEKNSDLKKTGATPLKAAAFTNIKVAEYTPKEA